MTDLTCRQVKQEHVFGKALSRRCTYEATGDDFLSMGTSSRGILHTWTAPGDVLVDVVSDRSSILLASTRRHQSQRKPADKICGLFVSLIHYRECTDPVILPPRSVPGAHRSISYWQQPVLRYSAPTAY